MEFRLGAININGIELGERSEIRDGTLRVNPREIEELVCRDGAVKACVVDVALPGESVRITPVKDVIEPRVKIDGQGGVFPGVISKVDTVDCGHTLVLRGCAVVTCGKIVGFQEGIIDMCGTGAEYTPFSRLSNLVLTIEPISGLAPHEHEKAVRMAGLKTATFLGELARGLTPDSSESYELLPLAESAAKHPSLPKVVYVQMLQSQGLLHDTYVYGVDAKKILPTLISPFEIMNGAIISGNCVSACDKNTTYHHQNNPVVTDLLARHGKELNFIGIIITNENVFLADKERSSNMTARLAEFLGAEGAIISQEGFGNPDTDLIMNCKKIEAKGIKTVIITDEYAGRDGMSQSLADADAAADAVVTGGNANELIVLPKLERVIGTLDPIEKIAGGFAGNTAEDGSVTVELQAITGATNELGFGTLSAR